jgi:hypothetical protein
MAHSPTNRDSGNQHLTNSLRRLYSFFLFTFLFTVPAVLYCQSTFYVAPDGDDSNPGTYTSPFRTVSKGVGQLAPGKTVYIRSGTYEESLDNMVPAGESWELPVTVAAFPGETVILKPAGGYGVFRPTGGSKHHIILQGLTLDGSEINYDVVKMDHSGSPLTGTHHVRLQNCEIRNSPGQGILINAEAAYNEFVGCVIHDNGKTWLQHGIYVSGAHNLIDGCTFYRNSGWGVHVFNEGATRDSAHDNIVRNNLVYQNGLATEECVGIGLYAGADNIAYNNLVYGNERGIAVDYGALRTKVYNNTITANSSIGLQVGSDASETVIRNNIVFGNWVTYRDIGTNTLQDHNLWLDPEFVDAAKNDYRLVSTSPAIDKGLTLEEFSEDRAGFPRPLGSAWDLGAFEFAPSGVAPSPMVPGSPAPMNGATDVSTNPTLGWNSSGDVTSYRLQVSMDTSFNLLVYNRDTTINRWQSISGLAANSTYYWRVSAGNADAVSQWSPVWNFTTASAPTSSQPSMQYSSKVLDFGSVLRGRVRSLPLVVTNEGFDSLRVNSIMLPNSVFSASLREFVLPAGGSLVDTITAAAPPDSGSIQSCALILSNSGTGLDTLALKLNVTTTSVNAGHENLPAAFFLGQNYPNPFNPSTTIPFGLHEASTVTMEIYDILGRKVRTLLNNEAMSASFHTVEWDGRADSGASAGTGIYFYRIRAGKSTWLKKMLLEK